MTPRQTGRIVAIVSLLALVLGASARAQTPWTVPAAEGSRKSPIASSAKVVEQGKKVAQVNCASCHGPAGKGNGPAAMALTPKPADWTSKKIQDESDGALFWKITTGRGPMPAWKHLPEADRWALVQYIRTLK
ncbi:MAG TPA: cytochrome c [Methylomirabilota bacterium]|jgi:mono/diheme cytochrome c family protein